MKKILIGLLLFPLMSLAQTPEDLSQYFDEKSLSIGDSQIEKTVHCDVNSPYYQSCDIDVNLFGLDFPRFSGSGGGIDTYDAQKNQKEIS